MPVKQSTHVICSELQLKSHSHTYANTPARPSATDIIENWFKHRSFYTQSIHSVHAQLYIRWFEMPPMWSLTFVFAAPSSSSSFSLYVYHLSLDYFFNFTWRPIENRWMSVFICCVFESEYYDLFEQVFANCECLCECEYVCHHRRRLWIIKIATNDAMPGPCLI